MKKFFSLMMLFVMGGLFSTVLGEDLLPEVGKTYYIKSDNVNANKVDEDYYLYNNNGTLSLSTTKGGDGYLWTCEMNGEFYRFKNKAGKYLGFKAMSETAFDFKITPADKVNEGCLPLRRTTDNKFMLVKNGGVAFDQADDAYNKSSTLFSSDYIFEEFNENAKMLTIQTDPEGAQATFSWNGESYIGACSFTANAGETIQNATLTAKDDPASPYEFIGFYDGEQSLGETVEISTLDENRTITAKFEFNIYSTTYGEKWIRINWNRDASYMMGLPASENYEGVAPKTITSDLGSEAQLWCLVGTADGFKLYNKAAGETLALATTGTNYGNGTVTTMQAAATATSWHLVKTANGLNISPVGNTTHGLNSFGGAAQDLKLYANNDGGNIWTFQKGGENALTFQVVVNGTPKALNTQIGQVAMSLGSAVNTVSLSMDQLSAQTFYLADQVNLGFYRSGNVYRGYQFKGFRVNGGELQDTIKNLPFDETLSKITVEYDVDTEDPSQYLFYTPGYQGHPYRIPAITTTNEGNILAISDFRWCNNDIGFGHVDIVGRISKDNGETWGEQFNIAVGSGIGGAKDCGYGDAAVVTDRETGRILIMCCTGNVFYSNGTRENPLRSARLYSEDGGKTWSEPEDITEQMYALLPTSTGQFIGAGKICQSQVTKVGEYYRLYAAMCTRIGNYVIYSDDFGQTWDILGPNNVSCAPDGNEPKCEELPDGSVVLSSRKYSGRYFNIYKYTNVETAEGSWLGAVSSNDVEGGLSVAWNSTNGEIQLAKVIKKDDKSFHYMMIQSLPQGRMNDGDEERSNVAIYYKVFDSYTMKSTMEIATGWTQGMVLENRKGGYSTMCIQPDKKLAFFYEEGPNNYCMVYRPISIEELTGDVYEMYDPAVHGEIDEAGRALEVVKKEAKELLDELNGQHVEEPNAYGQYPTSVYEELQTAYDEATIETITELENAIIRLKNAGNWPVFTINNMHPTYGKGKSIYDNNTGTLYFKETDTEDKEMWWKFGNLTTTTMANGDYNVTNVSTGKNFWGAEFLNVSSTNPATAGQFIIKTDGTGHPVHAQQNGSVVVRWNDYGPNTGSAWSFTYVGDSYDLEKEVSTSIEQVENGMDADEIYYDLQGRQVAVPGKGVYITKSGKKVLF